MKYCKHCKTILAGEAKQTRNKKFCGKACFYGFLRSGKAKILNQFSVAPWTDAEDTILRLEFPSIVKLRLLAKKLHRSVSRIWSRAKKLGLQRLPEATSEGRRAAGRKNKGRPRPDLSARNRVTKLTGERNGFYGKTHSEKTKELISKSQKKKSAFLRLNGDPTFQAKRQAAHAAKMKDPDYQRRRAASLVESQGGPNKMEIKLGSLLETILPGEYKYTGDGSVIIDGMAPDWTNINGQKKIIELFGEHVHDPKFAFFKVPERQTYKGRKKALAAFGYKTLIIWCREMKNIATVTRKIKRFHGS